MNRKDFYDAIWNADYEYMTHLAPGLHSFINFNEINELQDFFAMMFGYSI
jgi:hypothetical protein